LAPRHAMVSGNFRTLFAHNSSGHTLCGETLHGSKKTRCGGVLRGEALARVSERQWIVRNGRVGERLTCQRHRVVRTKGKRKSGTGGGTVKRARAGGLQCRKHTACGGEGWEGGIAQSCCAVAESSFGRCATTMVAHLPFSSPDPRVVSIPSRLCVALQLGDADPPQGPRKRNTRHHHQVERASRGRRAERQLAPCPLARITSHYVTALESPT
jgi:hypothetical protein